MNNHQVQSQSPATSADMPRDRQAFHRAHTTLGVGHWLKTIGILSPLIIGEFVKDPERRWRYARIAAVATAALSEGLYTHRIERERQERSECLKR
jgi:aminoglycoside/choline kinase family phosphotransferase